MSYRSRSRECFLYEKNARQSGYNFIAGVDEAGRGPLAGPVVAAACILPENYYIPGVDDSKKLSPKKRAILYDQIIHDPNIIYSVGVIDAQVIDEINIFQATIQAMLQAVDGLTIIPDYLLVDGLQLPHPEIEALKIIKGDSKSHSIAAASIVAKETRDIMMREYHQKWPEYNFAQHKGYPTKAHREIVKERGYSPIHRKTFTVR